MNQAAAAPRHKKFWERLQNPRALAAGKSSQVTRAQDGHGRSTKFTKQPSHHRVQVSRSQALCASLLVCRAPRTFPQTGWLFSHRSWKPKARVRPLSSACRGPSSLCPRAALPVCVCVLISFSWRDATHITSPPT